MTRESSIPNYNLLQGRLLLFQGEGGSIGLKIKYNKQHECLALYQVSGQFLRNIEFDIFRAFTERNEQHHFLQLVRPSYDKRHILLDAQCLEELIQKGVFRKEDGEQIGEILTSLSNEEQRNESSIWLEEDQAIEVIPNPMNVGVLNGGEAQELVSMEEKRLQIRSNKPRVYLTKTNGKHKYAVSLGDGKFLYSDEKNLEHLKDYLDGKLFLRRKNKLPVEPFPVNLINNTSSFGFNFIRSIFNLPPS